MFLTVFNTQMAKSKGFIVDEPQTNVLSDITARKTSFSHLKST